MDHQIGFSWIWFSCFPFLRLKTRMDLLEALGGPEAVFNAEESRLVAFRGINSDAAHLISSTGIDRVDEIINECKKQGLGIITCDDPAYPFRLKNIYSPPPVLYVKGKLPDIDDSAVISVIGTRKASQYGLRMGKKLAFDIAACGGTVVSLLTAGVDQAAAEGALSAGKPCIGVLGTPHELDRNPIADKIVADGAVISEYPPGSIQLRSFFRDRNRIASGISTGTVVVEAPEKSGTRFFVEEALEQGKDIYAVPGNADSENSKGTLYLLKMGARPVGSGWDVLAEYADMFPNLHHASEKIEDEAGNEDIAAVSEKEPPVSLPDCSIEDDWAGKIALLNQEQQAVISAMENGAGDTDSIIEASGLSAPKVLSNMTILEIKGLITRDLTGKIKLKKHC